MYVHACVFIWRCLCIMYMRDVRAPVSAQIAAGESHVEIMEKHDRMKRWVDFDDPVTPFPWVGQDFVEPCSQTDLDYYKKRPAAYPPGVLDWQTRRDAQEEQVPRACICWFDFDTCHGCCPWWNDHYDDNA